MVDARDPDRGHRRPLDGGEEDPAQGVPQGLAESPFQWLGNELPISTRQGLELTL